MPTYTMRAPDGRNYSISGPAGATSAQVQQQILAQHPQAGVVPAAGQSRPTLKAPPQPQQNWFQRLGNAVQSTAETYAHPVTAAFRGIQDGAFGGITDHIAAVGNEVGTAIGANTSNMSYSQRVQALRAQREAQMQVDAHGNSTAAALAHYAGEGAGMIGAGVAGGAAVRSAGLVAAPATTAIGRVGQAMTAGGVAGAAQGAGNATTLAEAPKDIAIGATVGAVAAPIVGAGAKFAGALAGRVTDVLGVTNASSILKRYIGTSAATLEANRAAEIAKGNPNPTLFELLPLADRQQVQKLLNIVPTASKEQAQTLLKQRAAAMGQEVSDHVAKVVQPQRQAIIDKMSNDLAASRGETAPSNEDITLAMKASRNPNLIAGNASTAEKGGVPTISQTINKNIMSPHDATEIPSIVGHDPVTGGVVPSTIKDLFPQHPVMGSDGQPGMEETMPEISAIIRNAAGLKSTQKSGMTVSDVTGMVSKLRGIANTSSDGNQKLMAAEAADHLISLLPEDAAEAHAAMTASHQNYSQMKEGYDAGLQTQLEQNVNPTSDVRGVQNQYVSQGGADGRLLGQASALDQQLGQGVKSLAPAADIANNPATQAAIDSNIPGAGQQIASAAQSQTQSAQRLSELNPTPNDQGGGLPAMAANLMRMASFSPAAKVHAGIQIMRALHPLPAEQSSQIVDALFSQNPTKIDMGLKFLNNSGQPGAGALSQLQTALQGTMTSLPVTTGGAGAVASAMTAPVAPQDPSQDPATPPDPAPVPDTAAAPAMPPDVNTDPAAPTAPAGPPSADPSAPNASPYAQQLQDAYAKADPKLLALANSVATKESGGRQFNKDGTPKISNKGAVGLMQVMPTSLPGIANRAGLPVDQVALHHDPAYNTLIGLHYLDQNMRHFGGDAQKSAAAYNAGPGRVQHAVALDPTGWLSHMPDETQAYAGDIK